MRRRHHSRLPAVLVSSCLWNTLVAANAPPQLELPKAPRELRTNTTSHLIFNTVSGLLQHWPNTIYRNGHTFVPGSIPAGTVLHHGRLSFDPPPSPEYFAFDVEHSYLFCFWAPCVMFTYRSKRDLRVGYFDGTGAATLEGPRDFQDIVFNDKFIPPGEYNPWDHAKSMCVWADRVGLDGIVRMEPSFEAILCNIESDLELVTEQELVYPETRVFPGQPRPFETYSNSTFLETHHQAHPRQRLLPPVSPGPTIPVYPAPPGWTGKQRDHDSVAFEAIRAGMWHNHSPGERRIILDYSGIVSAYDGSYKSLVRSRQGIPRSKHRLADISTSDKARLVDEVNEVLRHQHSAVEINWPALIQGVIDRYAERLEELQTLFKRVDLDPIVVAAAARRKVLIMLTPYMVFPQAKGSKIHTEPTHRQPQKQVSSIVPSQKVPDQDWLVRIHNTCAAYATAGILHRSALTKQEERLAKALDDVQSAICSSIVHIWASAFDSEDRPVLAKQMIDQWRTEVDELMGWLDWHTWVKCDPPCGPGLRCVLATWPWEIRTGDEDIGPMCRDYLLDAGF